MPATPTVAKLELRPVSVRSAVRAERAAERNRPRRWTVLFPTVSVTLIGLTAGLISLLLCRGRVWQELVRGLAGAWAGFLGGALAGVIMDIMLGTGVFVALIGHGLAALGALVAVVGLGRTMGQRDGRSSLVRLPESEPSLGDRRRPGRDDEG